MPQQSSKSRKPASHQARATAVRSIDPAALAAALSAPELKDFIAAGGPLQFVRSLFENAFAVPDEPEHLAYDQLRAIFLQSDGVETARLYDVLSKLDGFALVEDGIRMAGLAIGFVIATQVMTGAASRGAAAVSEVAR